MREMLVDNGVLPAVDASKLRIAPQQGEDLGARLQSAFAEAFAAEYDHVVVVGSDQPIIPAEYLTEAFCCTATV